MRYFERLPFRFGQSWLVKFDNDEDVTINNRRDSALPRSEVPLDMQLEAIERERARRADGE